MKKKYLIAIIAIVIVVGIVAIKINSKSNELTANSKNKIEQSNKPTEENKSNETTQGSESSEPVQENKSNEPTKLNKDNKATQDNKTSESVQENKSNEPTKTNQSNKTTQEKKTLTKEDFASLILKKESPNQPNSKYFIPIRALNNSYDKLERTNGSDAFLCNDNNKLDNGIIVELQGFNQNDKTHSFIIKDYNAIRNGGNGLIDKGTISNNGEVKFSM